VFDWHKAEKRLDKKSVEAKIFNKHKKLIQIRKAHAVFADNITNKWLPLENMAIAGFIRHSVEHDVFCLFNYSNQNQSLPESIFEALGKGPHKFKELWTNSSLEFKKPFRLFYDETLSIFNSEHLD